MCKRSKGSKAERETLRGWEEEGHERGKGAVKGAVDEEDKVLWRLLFRYRELKKTNKQLHHELYLQVKGNAFQNKTVLMESIHKKKMEKEMGVCILVISSTFNGC